MGWDFTLILFFPELMKFNEISHKLAITCSSLTLSEILKSSTIQSPDAGTEIKYIPCALTFTVVLCKLSGCASWVHEPRLPLNEEDETSDGKRK